MSPCNMKITWSVPDSATPCVKCQQKKTLIVFYQNPYWLHGLANEKEEHLEVKNSENYWAMENSARGGGVDLVWGVGMINERQKGATCGLTPNGRHTFTKQSKKWWWCVAMYFYFYVRDCRGLSWVRCLLVQTLSSMLTVRYVCVYVLLTHHIVISLLWYEK